jgi:RNA recognition motif-containing protein
LFIKNLDLGTEEKDIRNFFSRIGNIKDVKILKNHEGKPKGMAIVEFLSLNDSSKG